LFYIINRRTDKQIFASILFFLNHKNRSIFTKCTWYDYSRSGFLIRIFYAFFYDTRVTLFL